VAGGAKTVALNAADEVAVAAFLQGRIEFDSIPRIVREVLSATEVGKLESISQVLKADSEARVVARERVEQSGERAMGVRPVSTAMRVE
jgi:1-deoxy-D-xylulose-5-phosphate reductoisomerase